MKLIYYVYSLVIYCTKYIELVDTQVQAYLNCYENRNIGKYKHETITAQKMKFPADLVTFTEEILNGKLRFLCSV